MTDPNMIIAIGATAVVAIVTTATPFLIFDHLRLKRHARDVQDAAARRRAAQPDWHSLEAGLRGNAGSDA